MNPYHQKQDNTNIKVGIMLNKPENFQKSQNFSRERNQLNFDKENVMRENQNLQIDHKRQNHYQNTTANDKYPFKILSNENYNSQNAIQHGQPGKQNLQTFQKQNNNDPNLMAYHPNLLSYEAYLNINHSITQKNQLHENYFSHKMENSNQQGNSSERHVSRGFVPGREKYAQWQGNLYSTVSQSAHRRKNRPNHEIKIIDNIHEQRIQDSNQNINGFLRETKVIQEEVKNPQEYQTVNYSQPLFTEDQKKDLYHISHTLGGRYGWTNQYGLRIPKISFSPNCKECKSTGTVKSKFGNTNLPCPPCYEISGYCKECYGTGTNFKKGFLCSCQKQRKGLFRFLFTRKDNDRQTTPVYQNQNSKLFFQR